MGGSAFEETLEIDCCCLVRGSRGLVNGKTGMRLSKEKDPSTGGHQALVGGLADFVSEFLE